MRKHRQAIIKSVATLISLAITAGGYFLMCYLISFLIMTAPMLWLALHAIISIGYVVYQVLPISDKFTEWIYFKINVWYHLRKAEKADYEYVN